MRAPHIVGAFSLLAFFALLPACRDQAGPIPVLGTDLPVDDVVRERIEGLESRAHASEGDADAWYDLAVAYDANELSDLAEFAYRRSLELDEDRAEAWHHLGRMLAEQSEFEEAVESFDKASELEPRYAPARWRAGRLLKDLGRLDEARAALEQAIELAPEEPEGYVALAQLELDEADEAAAIEVLQRVLAFDPDNHHARTLLGRSLSLAGETERAEAELARAQDFVPEWVDPWEYAVRSKRVGPRMELAILRERLRVNGARSMIEDAQATLARRPDDLGAISVNAEALTQLGAVEDALKMLRAAAERRPDHPRVQLMLANAYRVQPDLDRAIVHTKKALELHPEFALARGWLGLLYMEAGRDEEALVEMNEALRQGYEDLTLLENLGRLQRMNSLDAEAVATFERGARAFPEHLPFFLFLAKARAEVSDFEGAWEAHARAAELAPGHREVLRFAEIIRGLELSKGNG